MEHTATSLLTPWTGFYVILGSGAAALTGLQFLVIAIAADAAIGSEGTTRAFATPTIVHFCGVLLFSTMLSAPWPSLSGLALGVGSCAIVGVAYAVRVLADAQRQTDYTPVLEDWIWHAALPLVAYGSLVADAVCLRSAPSLALFAIAGSSLLLLFVGIHNSWDSVIYIALRRKERSGTQG